jgi:N-acetylglucosaminyl-diphospho-decaprenol L-rhamnosyltransferase
MKLLVVIVNYRVAHLAIDCLKSVAMQIPSVPGGQVAVCENGTGDDSADRIQIAIDENGWAGWCSLTAISPNRGFTGGNNVILAPAMASETPPQYILLLNADTVLRPNAIASLVDFMDKNLEVGIAGSRIEDPDGTVQCSAFRFPTPLGEFEGAIKLGIVSRILRRWKAAPPAPSQACEAEWISGTSMIIRREVFRDIGLLDEGYFTYFDDVDYCFNARRAGWPVWYVPDSRVVHFEGQSTGIISRVPQRRPGYLYEARRRYFLKNRGPGYAALVDAARITGLALWRMRLLVTGKSDPTSQHLLSDTVRHSVFVAGFKVRDVENPSLKQKAR